MAFRSVGLELSAQTERSLSSNWSVWPLRLTPVFAGEIVVCMGCHLGPLERIGIVQGSIAFPSHPVDFHLALTPRILRPLNSYLRAPDRLNIHLPWLHKHPHLKAIQREAVAAEPAVAGTAGRIKGNRRRIELRVWSNGEAEGRLGRRSINQFLHFGGGRIPPFPTHRETFRSGTKGTIPNGTGESNSKTGTRRLGGG